MDALDLASDVERPAAAARSATAEIMGTIGFGFGRLDHLGCTIFTARRVP